MFLNELTKIEKDAFFSLCIHAAEANDVIEKQEYELLEEYCKEMDILWVEDAKIMSMEEIIDIIKLSSTRHKKIIVLEVLGMLYADGVFDIKEKEFIYKYSSEIGFKEDDIDLINSSIEKYLALVKELNDIVNA